MNKFIVFALIALTASAFSVPQVENYKGMNVVQCIQDISTITKDVTTLVEAMKSRPLNMTTDIPDIVTVLQAVQGALPACGANVDFAPITKDLFVGFKTPACITDLQSFVSDMKKTVDDVQAKAILSILSDVQTIIGDIKKISTDCKINAQYPSFITEAVPSGFNIEKCLSEAAPAAKVITEFFTENSTLHANMTHEVPHIIQAFQSIYNIITPECGFEFLQNELQIYLPKACVASTMDLISYAKNIQLDSKDMFKLMTVMTQAMASFEKVKSNCPVVALYMNSNSTTTRTA